MTFLLSLDIAAPPATVFDFVADFTTGVAGLVAPLAERLFQRGMRDNLGVLRKVLER
ncbi:MAG TPA: hypothetical protein VD814_07765 [Nocardioides sp.]|nr:hypothetical protein [Nocardioides sp.]